MSEWGPYIPVAQRRASAAKLAKAHAKKGVALSPVVITERTIAKSFWGKAWCTHLETYSDYASRLPRGRSYARNGSVIDLQIGPGEVRAQVSGSRLYQTTVTVQALEPKRWKGVVQTHATQVSSVVELLLGKLPKSLLEALADKSSGLFPGPRELTFSCSCPDWADMCKHVAAVLYGVGARLDARPELFFLLRGVEVAELAAKGAALDVRAQGADDLAGGDLGALFGIELAEEGVAQAPKGKPAKKKAPARRKAKVAPQRPVRAAKKGKAARKKAK